jgi:chemotaxis protein MotB
MSHSADSYSKDEGYYASMADLMAGMLFIFIIVAMVFAIDVRQDRVEAVAEAAAKAEARVKAEAEAKAELKSPATPLDRPVPVDMYIEVRARLVEAIRDYLAARGVRVESEPREGLLRLPADRLFAPAGATPLHDGQVAFSHLADALDTYLPCLAKGAPLPDSAVCKPFTEARLRTVRIETHVESGPRSAAEAESLTGARAVHLLSGLLSVRPHLMDLRNDAAERLIDVRGMGAQWPLEAGQDRAGPDNAGKAAPVRGHAVKGSAVKGVAGKGETGTGETARVRSRRIDLRFDMFVPGTEQPAQAEGVILRPTAK